MSGQSATSSSLGGKVIKTLTNIRFIRFTRTPRLPTPRPRPAGQIAADEAPRPEDVLCQPQKRATDLPAAARGIEIGRHGGTRARAKAYVQRDNEPGVVQDGPPLHHWTNLRTAMPDPDTEALIAWCCAKRDQLPVNPYQLTAWQRIVNPRRFHDALAMDIAAYSHGPRSRVIGEDLRHLREFLERPE